MGRVSSPGKGRVPLERALSKLGIASRGVAREWILAGRIRVDGVVRRDPAFPVVPESERIERDGETMRRPPPRTILLHKPRGVTVTRRDERGRPTVYSLLPPELASLHPVGRLDLATSGLLLLTNDGRLSSFIADPANRIPRTYLVTVRGRFAPAGAARLVAGVADEGELLRAERAELRKASGRESELVIVLSEGRNREVRRMCLALGHEVTRLRRVALGGLRLLDLAPGRFREVSPAELRAAFPGAPAGRREG